MNRTRSGIQVDANDVVVAAGAKPFIGYSILSVTDYGAGDEVIYPVPGFPIYESQIKANGAVGVPIFLREERNFGFDPQELADKITPRTKLLILNSPTTQRAASSPQRLRSYRRDLAQAPPNLDIRRRNLWATGV